MSRTLKPLALFLWPSVAWSAGSELCFSKQNEHMIVKRLLLCLLWVVEEEIYKTLFQSRRKNNMAYVTIKKLNGQSKKKYLWFDVLEVTVRRDKALYLQDNEKS